MDLRFKLIVFWKDNDIVTSYHDTEVLAKAWQILMHRYYGRYIKWSKIEPVFTCNKSEWEFFHNMFEEGDEND